jgi:anaerobic magnesium-protoporphyrin IX monomethyl ester cyclase
MHVVLIETPKFVDIKNHVSTVAVPPLGLAYVAGSLEHAGHRVSAIDAIGEAIEQLNPYDGQIYVRGLTTEQILGRVPEDVELIGLGCMFSYQWLIVKDLIWALREAFQDVPIVFGGEHPTGSPRQCLEESPLDAVVLGEGEETAVELVEAVHGSRSWSEVAGIAYRHNGEIVENGRRARITAIDSIPLPAWHLFDIDEYCRFNQPHGSSQGRFMPMLATRGCPFQCTFCTSPQMWTTKWMPRDVAQLVDEMELYVERYRTVDFQFEDLTAVVRRDWILAFCHELIDRGLNITFQLPSGTRSEGIDYEVARAMKQAGCHEFAFAPESGDPRILKAIKKKVQLPRMFHSARESMRAGLNVGCFFILGFPEDDLKSVLRTYVAIIKCAIYGFSSMNLNAYSPQPNTESMRGLLERGVIDKLDDSYYMSLFTYSGLGAKTSYCRFSSRTLGTMIIVGYSVFYSIYFVSRPRRTASIVADMFRENSSNKVSKYLRSLLSDMFRIRRQPSRG